MNARVLLPLALALGSCDLGWTLCTDEVVPAIEVEVRDATTGDPAACNALLVVRGRIDAIVSGLAVNLVAAGGTRFVLRALYGSSSNSPSVRGVRLPGGLLVQTLLDPFVLATLAVRRWITAHLDELPTVAELDTDA